MTPIPQPEEWELCKYHKDDDHPYDLELCRNPDTPFYNCETNRGKFLCPFTCIPHTNAPGRDTIHFIAEMDRMSFDNAICLSGIEEGSRKEDFIKIMGIANVGTKVNVSISVRK